jgi:hypothetical protein
MQCDVFMMQVKGLTDFLWKQREAGFTSTEISTIEIVSTMEVGPKFGSRCIKQKKVGKQ